MLGEFLEQVFAASARSTQRPLLRGVYFTSGTQEGTPIDRVLGTLARTFGSSARGGDRRPGRGKSFFLTACCKDVVFAERGLAPATDLAVRSAACCAACGYGAWLLRRSRWWSAGA